MAGVRVTAIPDSWEADPHDLWKYVTPLQVRIDNNSGAPLQVRYRHFNLTTDTGFTRAAIPPFRIQGAVQRTGVALSPSFSYGGFYVAPYYSPFYRGYLNPWGGPFGYDGGYWTNYYSWNEPLPTTDMLEKAIPEGVVSDKGYLQGFLYFQHLGRDARGMMLETTLINADTEDRIGEISIPFVAR